MKTTQFMIGVWLFVFMCQLGCGPSQENSDKVVKVGTEIATIQKDYYPAITELGRVSVQIEALAKNQTAAIKPLEGDIAAAQQLITKAFAAGEKAQDAAVVGMPKGMTLEKYIVAEENFRDLLRQALDDTRAAVVKSQEVLSKVPTKIGR